MERDAYEIFTQAHRVYIKGIRTAIAERLQSVYGTEWWERGVLPAIGENQRDNLERDLQKGAPEDMSELLDTAHFARIVERNYADFFADGFTTIDYTLQRFNHLSLKRNEWAHVRDGQWTVPDIMQSVQAMREILISLRRREALEIHQMFQESLDQQGAIREEFLNVREEFLNVLQELPFDGDDDSLGADYFLLGFWRALESYLAVEADVVPQEKEELDRRGRKYVNVLVRVTNTAPASEGRPDIRFRDIAVYVRGGGNGREERSLGRLDPGETREEQFRFAEKSLGSVEFRVSGAVDQDRLFLFQRRGILPDEVVTPLLEQLSSQFEAVGIEEALNKVIGTVDRIQPTSTLVEVAAIRSDLVQLKPAIAEKRESLDALLREYHLTKESPVGASLLEAIQFLRDLEQNKMSAMDSAISETDLESISSVTHDFEQLQISVLRTRDAIRERMRSSRL